MSHMTLPVTTLVVVSDLRLRQGMKSALERLGPVQTCGTVDEARHAIQARTYDLIVADEDLADGSSGLSFWAWLLSHGIGIPFILLSDSDGPSPQDYSPLGAHRPSPEIHKKPFSMETLFRRAQALVNEEMLVNAALASLEPTLPGNL